MVDVIDRASGTVHPVPLHAAAGVLAGHRSRTVLCAVLLALALVLAGGGTAQASSTTTLEVVDAEDIHWADWIPEGRYLQAYAPKPGNGNRWTFRMRLYRDKPTAGAGDVEEETDFVSQTPCSRAGGGVMYLYALSSESHNGDWHARLVVYHGKDADELCEDDGPPTSYSDTASVVVEGCPGDCREGSDEPGDEGGDGDGGGGDPDDGDADDGDDEAGSGPGNNGQGNARGHNR